MKTLSLNNLEQINGGWRDAADSFCAGVGIVALFTPVTGALGVGCAIYGIWRAFE